MISKSKRPILFISLAYLFALVIIILTLYVGRTYNIPFEKITGDPANYYRAHPFTGIVSNIGALLWCATATSCLFAGFYLLKSKRKEANFLLLSGFFSIVLLIDDFFMFHDYLFYSYNQVVLEPIIYGLYLVLLLFFIYKYTKLILKTDYLILALAICFLGLSVLCDLLFPSEGLQYFIEDSLKFMGIVSWMLFFTTTAFKMLSE